MNFDKISRKICLFPSLGPCLSCIGRQDIHVKERVAIHHLHFSVDERQVDARTICLARQMTEFLDLLPIYICMCIYIYIYICKFNKYSHHQIEIIPPEKKWGPRFINPILNQGFLRGGTQGRDYGEKKKTWTLKKRTGETSPKFASHHNSPKMAW